ncbi:MAG TPA: hypothetical protein VL463_25445 [Kofleriaceae bacterium]|nr:hypothetical protein [Kofleriaceae bacterium]
MALGAGLAAAACGGDKNNNTADARVSDAAKAIDATPDARVQVRTGTLAVASVNITDPGAAQLALGGASISLEFSDLTKEDGGMVTFGSGAIGECTVVQYDSTHKPHPLVDEGPITISGDGLKKPVGTCTFQGGAYVCVTDHQDNVAGTYSASNASGGAAITVTGHDFTTAQVGMYVSLSGFTDGGMNHTYPIVNIIGTSAQLGVPAGVAQNASNQAFSGVSYTLIQGAGPIPGGAATVDFINVGSGGDHVTIAMAANADYATAISSSLSPIGKGIKLNGPGGNCADCAQPHQFPKTAGSGETVSFSCDPTAGDKTGTCGEDGDQLAVGLVITGRTTDAAVGGLPPYAMPDPTGTWAAFTCKFPTAKGAQIPNGAIAAILATNPKRIETRVFRFAFGLGTDTDTLNDWATVSGHGLVGHTDL